MLPLLPGQALAIGVTSYDGKVFYGLDADRDALPDLDVLAACILESLDELVDASSSSRGRAPRGKVTQADRDPDVHDAETSRQARRDQEDCRHEG